MRYGSGFVIGKFQPPHPGHFHLIDTALERSYVVTVVVVDRRVGEKREIPAKLRAQWILDHYKDSGVKSRLNVETYYQPPWLPDENSEMWGAITMQKWGRPDAVFTSEEYGAPWAKAMKCDHVLVDLDRKEFNFSGTKIRENPYAYWDHLDEGVKSWYVKRVVVTGAESTGTTTLAKSLASVFKTAWVPEYGRILYEGFEPVPNSAELWTPDDLRHIAKVHAEIEDHMARKANKILFLDTDTMTTQQWFKRYWGHEDKEIGSLQYERHHDAYILTTPDFPFVQDGFRNDPPEGREPLQVNLKEAIVRSRLPYLEVRGSKAARLHNAVRFIEDKLGVEYKDV